MPSRSATRLAVLVPGVHLLVWAFAVGSMAANPSYTVTNIGRLPGYESIHLNNVGEQGLNDRGQAIAICTHVIDQGDCSSGRPPRYQQIAVRYTPGVGIESVSGSSSEIFVLPEAINASGQVFGQAAEVAFTLDSGCIVHPTTTSARVWRYSDGIGHETLPVPASVAVSFTFATQKGQLTDAGIAAVSTFSFSPSAGLAIGGGRALASGWEDVSSLDTRLVPGKTSLTQMNNSGQLCGNVIGPSAMAFRFSPGIGIESIPDIGNPRATTVRAINEAGDMTGLVITPPNARMHAWVARGSLTPLDIHDDSLSAQSEGRLINGTHVAGMLTDVSGSRVAPFHWDTSHGMVPIPLDPFFLSFDPRCMNRHGAVIGDMRTDIDFAKPWVWTPESGTVYLRDGVGDPAEEHWRFITAPAINERGQILVYGSDVQANEAAVFVLTPVCRADANGSGSLEIADIFSFLNAWFAGCNGAAGTGPCAGINADFDENGTLEVADIFAFLNAWFAGC